MRNCYKSKNWSIITSVVFFVLISTFIYGQGEYTVTVDSPAIIAGSYRGVTAEISNVCNDVPISAELMVVNDGTSNSSLGCNPLVNDLTGSIALVDRGECGFGDKIINAQNAGAIAVIVCNNLEDPIFSISADEFEPHAGAITIPVVMVDFLDCQIIRSEIPIVNVTLTPIFQAPSGSEIIFYEEDFNAGSNGWVSVSNNEPEEVFTWSPSGFFPTYDGNLVELTIFGSMCTPAMGFPSGYYQTGMTGDPDDIPSPFVAYDAELISPVLDLSGISDEVALTFDQSVKRLNGNSEAGWTFVAFSIDGGETWSEPIVINEDVPSSTLEEREPATESTPVIRIPNIQSEPNVRLRFMWQADFYYWIIDNVRIIKAPPPVSTLEIEQKDFMVLVPNPSDGLISLSLELQHPQPVQVRILDAGGRVVLKEAYHSALNETINYDLRLLPGGVYFVNVVTDKGVSTERIVIRH